MKKCGSPCSVHGKIYKQLKKNTTQKKEKKTFMTAKKKIQKSRRNREKEGKEEVM